SGRGPLAPPHSLADVGAWVEQRGAVTAFVAFVRLGALAVAAWCALIVVVASVARAAGAVRVAAWVARLAPAFVASALTVVPVAAQPHDEGTATMVVLPDQQAPEPAPVPVPVGPPAPA